MLPETCIKASTSEKGCCPKCGTPWERIVKTEKSTEKFQEHPSWENAYYTEKSGADSDHNRASVSELYADTFQKERKTVGWEPGCKCPPAEPIPCIVLDPFAGSGTTLAVARRLGRRSVGVELNPEYVKLIELRPEGGADLDAEW
jgi:hypothetical protein